MADLRSHPRSAGPRDDRTRRGPAGNQHVAVRRACGRQSRSAPYRTDGVVGAGAVLTPPLVAGASGTDRQPRDGGARARSCDLRRHRTEWSGTRLPAAGPPGAQRRAGAAHVVQECHHLAHRQLAAGGGARACAGRCALCFRRHDARLRRRRRPDDLCGRGVALRTPSLAGA